MYKQGDIVMVPMSYADLSSGKIRPALVLSKDNYNQKSTDILAVMITSTRNRKPFDVTIHEDDMAQGALPKQSYVRSDRVFSIAQKLVKKTYGSVRDSFYQSVYEVINHLITLPERN